MSISKSSSYVATLGSDKLNKNLDFGKSYGALGSFVHLSNLQFLHFKKWVLEEFLLY